MDPAYAVVESSVRPYSCANLIWIFGAPDYQPGDPVMLDLIGRVRTHPNTRSGGPNAPGVYVAGETSGPDVNVLDLFGTGLDNSGRPIM